MTKKLIHCLNYLCNECKTKFDNKEFIECENCGRFQARWYQYKKTCSCFSKNYEEELETEREIQLDAWQVSERWNKEQKQELLDKVKKLEEENGNHKQEIQRLKELISECDNCSLINQIEIPLK